MAALVAAASLSSPVMAKNYSPSKVINAMGVANNRLHIIVEHRGAFHQDCPENSNCSINATAHEGVEAVEIDVRESSNGTLWPIHDTKIGRVTNYSFNGKLFNPYEVSTANESNNPSIALMNDAALQKLKLRDPLGVVTRFSFVPLETLMRYAHQSNNNLVYIFDIKTASAIQKTAAMVRKLRIEDRSVLKFNGNLTTPAAVSRLTQGVRFVPVIGTGSLDSIVDNNHLEKNNSQGRVNAYVWDYSHASGFLYFEIRNKMYGGSSSDYIMNGMPIEGPLVFLIKNLVTARIPVGGFSPQVEHYARNGEPGTGYYTVEGHCCTPLEARMDSSRYFGNDTRDDRSSLIAMVAANNVIIAERGADALAQAVRDGSRADEARIMN